MILKNVMSKQWIDNIKKLDSKNHLKHGEFYAEDGSVQDLEINGNIITARVEGTPGDFYNVTIEFEKFEKTLIDQLTDNIKNNPVISSEIANNELPEELFHTDLAIFPDSLKDFEMSCSCNRGLFCKHEAAVFHKVAKEISNNPHLVFSLRGLDILQKTDNDSNSIKTIQDIMEDESEPDLTESDDNHGIHLLSDFPSFKSNGENFKEVLSGILKRMTKVITWIYSDEDKSTFEEYINLRNEFRYHPNMSYEDFKKVFEDRWAMPETWKKFEMNLDSNYELISINTGKSENNFKYSLQDKLFAFFAELKQTDISIYCEDIQFLSELFDFTLQLIYFNKLIPEFFELDNRKYHVRWIPSFEKKIHDKLHDFYNRCPEELVTFNGSLISQKNQINIIISLFFEGFSLYYMREWLPYSLSPYTHERYFRLFFIRSQDLPEHYYKNKANEINNWLEPLFLKQKDYKLIINTHQEDDQFRLELKIKLNNRLYDFKDISELKRKDIIKSIEIINNIYPNAILAFDAKENYTMDLSQYSEFLYYYTPILRETGIEVNVPDDFESTKDAKLVLNTNIDNSSSSLSLDDLADFDWKVAIGDETFTIEEFEIFSTSYRGLVKIRNRYYLIDNSDLEKVQKDILNIPQIHDKTDLLTYILSSASDNIDIDDELEHIINNLFKIDNINIPETLNATLRDYQETGFSWLVQNLHNGFGSILADDMGLGKTIQIITLILYLKENDKLNDNKVLIVTPTSILTNWMAEIEKFAPSLNAEIYHGPNREFPQKDYDILLTSYGTVRQDIEKFRKKSWFLIVIDEAQNIKNPNTKQTKAVKSIPSQNHIALSGTPVENHLGEYWSLFDFTNKGYLNSLKNFKQKFLNPIEKERDEKVLEDFKKITSPFILRRQKTDKNIIKELPEKIINDIYCNLTVKQATLYNETLNVLINDVSESEGMKRKGLVLKLINALKQICNHPAQYLKSDDFKVSESGKMEVLINILSNILEADEKVLIFTQYVQMGELMKKMIEDKKYYSCMENYPVKNVTK